MSSLNALDAASNDRKARLANLRNLKRKQPTEETVDSEPQRTQSPLAEQDLASLHLSGRNYDAETRGPKLGFDAPPTQGLDKQTLEEQAAEIEADVREKAKEDEVADKGIDLFKLQPKKPNWDLKRDLGKKLEGLNVRTDNAIARLVRERIKAAQPAHDGGTTSTSAGEGDAGAAGLDGIALVEGLRVREKENEEEKQRAKMEEVESLAL